MEKSTSEITIYTNLLAAALNDRSYKLFTCRNRFTPPCGLNRVSTQRLSSLKPKPQASRAEALAASSGIRLGQRPVTGTEGQKLTIVGRDGETTFEGALGLNRLQYIPTERLGGDLVALDWYISEEALLFVVDVSTYARWIRSGSAAGSRVPAVWWEKRALSRQYINLSGHRSLQRSRRFFECVLTLHAEIYALCATFKTAFPEPSRQLSYLGRCLLVSMLQEGKCRTALVETFLSTIEVVHRDQTACFLEETFKGWPQSILVSAYRLRRSIYSDEWNPAVLQHCAVLRLQKEPVVLSARGESMLSYWQTTLRRWIKQHPGSVAKCMGMNFHKSSASFLSRRVEGGGSRELHLVVGLYRLSKGTPSPLVDVFGQVSSKDTICVLVEKYEQIDKQEISDACVWWCQLIRERGWPLGMMLSIFPEREPKGRTFCVPWVAPEILASPAVELVRQFLADQPETARSCAGREEQYRHLVRHASLPQRMRLDSDSQDATDHFSASLVHEFYLPAFEVFPKAVEIGVQFAGERGPVILASKRGKILDDVLQLIWTPRVGVQVDEEKKGTSYPESRRYLRAYTGKISLAITQYEGDILRAAAKGPLVLKAFTGAGKTTWLASQGHVVISLPSIGQCMLLMDTLAIAGIEALPYWSGLPYPGKNYEGCIVCTPAHVHALLKANYKRMYVCDEAETPQMGPCLNMLYCLKKGIFFIACSATPEELNLPIPILEVLGERRFSLELKENNEADLRELVLTELNTPSTRILILVHSEPKALSLERSLRRDQVDVRASLSAHSEEETREVFASRVMIGTNKYRSGVTIPGLTLVIDYQRQYQYICDSATGITTGVITRVTPAQILQAQGRGGRTCDSVYVTLTSNILCSESISIVQETEEAARLVHELDLGVLPLPYASGSLEKNLTTVALTNAYSGKNFFTRGLPASIRFLRKIQMLSEHRSRLGLVVCFETFGFRQRLREISRVGDEELSSIETDFLRDIALDDFTVAYCNVFIKFVQHKLYGRDTAMACRWLKLEHSEEGIRGCLAGGPFWDSNLSRSAITILLWDAVVRGEGNQYSGIFSHFRAYRSDGESLLALLLGREVDSVTGSITFARSLRLNVSEVEFLSDLFRDLKDGEPTVSRVNSVRYFIHLVKTDSQPYLSASEKPAGASLTAKPEQLDSILIAIESGLAKITDRVETTTSGVNMASRISPRMLLGLCWVAGMTAKSSLPKLEFEVYGDDFAGSCDDTVGALNLISELRGEFGMVVKPSASSEQRARKTLTVITERFFDGNGGEVEGLKPSSFIKLFLSQNPNWSMIHTGLERTDYIGDYHALEMKFPAAIANLGIVNPAMERRRRRRITHSRLLARRLLNHEIDRDTSQAGFARQKTVDGLLTGIEELILLISPSTRGSGRVYDTAGVRDPVNGCSQRVLTRVQEQLGRVFAD